MNNLIIIIHFFRSWSLQLFQIKLITRIHAFLHEIFSRWRYTSFKHHFTKSLSQFFWLLFQVHTLSESVIFLLFAFYYFLKLFSNFRRKYSFDSIYNGWINNFHLLILLLIIISLFLSLIELFNKNFLLIESLLWFFWW